MAGIGGQGAAQLPVFEERSEEWRESVAREARQHPVFEERSEK